MKKGQAMARIVFFIRKLLGGGAERQLILVSQELVRLGHDVTIVAWRPGAPYEGELNGSGIHYLVVEKRGLAYLPKFSHQIISMARHIRPDVVHGYMDPGNFIAALLRPFLPRCRIVWGIRGSALVLPRNDFGGRLLSYLNRVMSHFAHIIICNSNEGATHIARCGYPVKRIRVIANGIDVERFQPQPERGALLRARWGVKAGEKIIGLAARLDPMKDYETFVKAATVLAAQRRGVRFMCVGEGVEPYRSAALTTLRQSGLGDLLRWEGFMDDMPAFYSALDVATLTSCTEGFPNSIAEAMACGVPCIVTSVGDAPLIVGNTGEVVPVRCPEALAAGWQRLLDRVGPDLSTACRTRIVDQFSVSRLVVATEDAILPPNRRRHGKATAPDQAYRISKPLSAL
jgi:glycosyltransferase involved in cell wall biosynthesis